MGSVRMRVGLSGVSGTLWQRQTAMWYNGGEVKTSDHLYLPFANYHLRLLVS